MGGRLVHEFDLYTSKYGSLFTLCWHYNSSPDLWLTEMGDTAGFFTSKTRFIPLGIAFGGCRKHVEWFRFYSFRKRLRLMSLTCCPTHRNARFTFNPLWSCNGSTSCSILHIYFSGSEISTRLVNNQTHQTKMNHYQQSETFYSRGPRGQ